MIRARLADGLRAITPFGLLASLLTLPVWLDPAHRVLGRAEGEFRDHLWVAWLFRTRVLEDHALPITFPQAAFPAGLHLYPLDPLTQTAITLLSIPLGLLPAFILVCTALLAFVGFAAARLATALGAAPGSARVAGLLTMMGPPVLGVFADTQTEGMGLGWMALLLAEAVAPEPWTHERALRLGGYAGALAASAPYQAHGIALLAVPLVLHAVWTRRLSLRGLGTTVVVALPVLLLVGGGFLLAETREGGQIHARASVEHVSGDHPDRGGDWPPRTVLDEASVAAALVQASSTSPRIAFAWPSDGRFHPPTTGPRRTGGYVLPTLAVLAALRDRRARWVLAAAALYAALALGSARDHDAWTALGSLRIPLPFDLWYRYYPLGHLAWKPAQYAIPAWILGVAAFALLPRRALYAGALACLVELQLTGPTPAPLPARALTPLPAYVDLAADSAPGGVIEFPCRARSRAGIDALPFDVLLGQLVHHHPIGEAFGRGQNPPHQALLDALGLTLGWNVGRGPPLAAAIRSVQKAGFHAILVHGQLLDDHEVDALDVALTTWTAPPRVYPDGVRVYLLPTLPTATLPPPPPLP